MCYWRFMKHFATLRSVYLIEIILNVLTYADVCKHFLWHFNAHRTLEAHFLNARCSLGGLQIINFFETDIMFKMCTQVVFIA